MVLQYVDRTRHACTAATPFLADLLAGSSQLIAHLSLLHLSLASACSLLVGD